MPSRGGSDIKEIVKRIDMWALDMVFVVGGNGGNAGADAIQQELKKSGVPCSVIGVPKSIDNDILLVWHARHTTLQEKAELALSTPTLQCYTLLIFPFCVMVWR